MRRTLLFTSIGIAVVVACGSSSDDGTPATGVDGGGTDGGGTDAPMGSDGEPPPGNLAPWTNGTRLRAVVDVAGEARQWVTWHDQKLDVDCTYRVAGDGKTRCVPEIDTAYGMYEDSDCKKTVGVHGVRKTRAHSRVDRRITGGASEDDRKSRWAKAIRGRRSAGQRSARAEFSPRS